MKNTISLTLISLQSTQVKDRFYWDHPNAYQRLQDARWIGYKNLILDDNYPVGQGDCYSLKRIFHHLGTTSFQMRSSYESVDRNYIVRKNRKNFMAFV